MKRWLVSCVAGLALAPAACALAEHRALIVGVGDHQDATMNLPGIGLDTAMMAAAERLGFPAASIRTLLNEEATWAAFRRGLQASRGQSTWRTTACSSTSAATAPMCQTTTATRRTTTKTKPECRTTPHCWRLCCAASLRDDDFQRLPLPAANVLALETPMIPHRPAHIAVRKRSRQRRIK